jgi:transcriptional regulator with XRE-family HTH domain
MRVRSESKNVLRSNESHKPVLLFVPCFLTCMVILTSISVHPIFAQEQESGGTETDTNQNNTNLSNSSLVDFASNIEQIRGHVQQAVANKEMGNTTLAKAHTLHPIEEIYSSIEVQIDASDPNLNQSLSSSLNQLSNMVDNSTTEEFETEATGLNGLLNDTISKVVPSQEINSIAFNLMIVADLLSVAGNEYKEGVENGTVKAIVEYQDGQAFISRAQSVFNETSPNIPQEEFAEVEETNGFFSDLDNAVQAKADPELVSNSIRAIMHEISEVTGMSEAELSPIASSGDGDPVAIISEIHDLLNQTLDAYKNQNYGEAETLAIQAYLDNYEFIETPLAEQNQTLMETTELMLREELRQLIQNNASIQEMQQHIAKINNNLNQAEGLLTGSG